MSEAREEHTATPLPGGGVLIAGGFGARALLASAELYDPGTGFWTLAGRMIEARGGHAATPLRDGKVLVVGGRGGTGEGVALASAELYDPSSGRWTATGSLRGARVSHTATLLGDGRVLVAGGYSGATTVASAELYDPRNASWAITGAMVAARQAHTATLLLDGRVLVVGGASVSGGMPVSAEIYDPSSGSWTATGAIAEARAQHTATLLPDGTVLIAGGGGEGEGSVLATAELYDPKCGSWTATGGMIEARGSHEAALLSDGTVIAAGGGGGGGPNLASAELYDPGSGSWSATASMDMIRLSHTATLLPDGRLLVAGGVGGKGDAFAVLASAQLYDPTGTFSDVEAFLLSGLRSDARLACAPRLVDLPAHAVAGVECSPEVDLVDRIGVYLFAARDELLETYFDRLAEYGVEPSSGSCPQRAGEHAYVPGDSGPTIGPYRLGCFLNEFGNANYRFTAPDSLVYVGILGTGKDLEALHDWAWLGNQDVPGEPTVWRGPAR